MTRRRADEAESPLSPGTAFQGDLLKLWTANKRAAAARGSIAQNQARTLESYWKSYSRCVILGEYLNFIMFYASANNFRWWWTDGTQAGVTHGPGASSDQ